MVNMQHQNGDANSGLFAILVAVSLCHGKDPAAHLKNQSLMRKHLVSYLENREIVVFPDSTMKPVHSSPNTQYLQVPKDSKLGNIAQCKQYKQWYHQQCANISSLVFLMPAPSGFVKVVYYS